MNYKESLAIVMMLHKRIPSDKRATQAEIMERAKGYAVSMAAEDFETVKKAAEFIIRTSIFYPSEKEILEAVKRCKIAEVTPITEAESVNDPEMEEYIEAFCNWIGFEGEPKEDALEEYYDKHPERLEKMRRFLKYEE